MAFSSPVRSTGPNVNEMMKINVLSINPNQEIKIFIQSKDTFQAIKY